MSMAQPIHRTYPESVTAPAVEPPAVRPRPPAAPRTRSRRGAWADLRPMITLTFVGACLGLMSVVYLTAFARLTAHGTRISELDRQIAAAEADLQRSKGEISRLTRRDRIEHEAPRLGLVQLPAGEAADACATRAVSYEPLPRQVSRGGGNLVATRN
ncbi:MAG: hypothetical protein HZB16_07325 [Armatimonadetes bacterium]|nr:hypothetical protein [Armatimonadota bacterium]